MTHLDTTTSEEKILSQLSQTIRDIQYDLKSPHRMQENKYETIRDLVNNLEVRFFATATPSTLHPTYKKLLTGWTSLMIKQKEVWIDDYLRFFTSDDWQYWKIRTLILFRLCRNPAWELPVIFPRLLDLLAEAYQKNPEWIQNIISIWQEYCSRVFMLSTFQSVSEKQKFLRIDHSFYSILSETETYQPYLKKTLLTDIYIEDDILPAEITEPKDTIVQQEPTDNLRATQLIQIEEDYLVLYEKFEILHREHLALQKNYDSLLAFYKDKEQWIVEEEILPKKWPVEIDRTQYRFWLIFWSSHSAKSFERDNKNKNDLYLEYGLTKDNFEVFTREWGDQARLNISPILNRLNWIWAKPLSGLIVFELDHETELNSLVNNPDYSSQIFVCHGSSQHYTKLQMRQLLTQLIDTVEWEMRNNQ